VVSVYVSAGRSVVSVHYCIAVVSLCSVRKSVALVCYECGVSWCESVYLVVMDVVFPSIMCGVGECCVSVSVMVSVYLQCHECGVNVVSVYLQCHECGVVFE
jgi:ribosomal protein L33